MPDKQEVFVVRTAPTTEEAAIIKAWLAEQGIEATITDPASFGVFAFGVTDDQGVRICVRGEAQAQRAISLLKQHDEESRRKHG